MGALIVLSPDDPRLGHQGDWPTVAIDGKPYDRRNPYGVRMLGGGHFVVLVRGFDGDVSLGTTSNHPDDGSLDMDKPKSKGRAARAGKPTPTAK